MNLFYISDYDIQALVDNELSKEDEQRIRANMYKNSEALSRYNELIDQKNMLKRWWKNNQN